MAAQIEQLADDKVKLTVDVPADDVHHAVEHAAADLAASVRIPGFRQGKVPMPILVQRVGRERLYSEAVESHIGGWFWNAADARASEPGRAARVRVRPADVRPRGLAGSRRRSTCSPSPSLRTGRQLEVPKQRGRRCPRKPCRPSSRRCSASVAELVPVEGRAAQQGDTVVVDLGAEDGSAQRDYVVELGSDRLVEEIENGILAALQAGESRDIAYELADGGQPQGDGRR